MESRSTTLFSEVADVGIFDRWLCYLIKTPGPVLPGSCVTMLYLIKQASRTSHVVLRYTGKSPTTVICIMDEFPEAIAFGLVNQCYLTLERNVEPMQRPCDSLVIPTVQSSIPALSDLPEVRVLTLPNAMGAANSEQPAHLDQMLKEDEPVADEPEDDDDDFNEIFVWFSDEEFGCTGTVGAYRANVMEIDSNAFELFKWCIAILQLLPTIPPSRVVVVQGNDAKGLELDHAVYEYITDGPEYLSWLGQQFKIACSVAFPTIFSLNFALGLDDCVVLLEQLGSLHWGNRVSLVETVFSLVVGALARKHSSQTPHDIAEKKNPLEQSRKWDKGWRTASKRWMRARLFFSVINRNQMQSIDSREGWTGKGYRRALPWHASALR
ncbi:hypothetical protein C8R45DRAFT_931253 [Mycena sanguinolenta]|nr:hypothetical protein C8R45DRAFT_931253 [Mycena sanguinolenta]